MSDSDLTVEGIENPSIAQLYADLSGVYGRTLAMPAAVLAKVVGTWKRLEADDDERVVWVLQNGGDRE